MADLYAVIGNPISQSKSPAIHKSFALQTGQDMEYRAVEGTIGNFAAGVDALRAKGLRGLNITTPFKLDAFAYATRLSGAAKRAGAINCLTFSPEGADGDNFDGIGLVRDITANLRFALTRRRVLLLGAGGAVRGALIPFLEERPEELVIVHRNLQAAAALSKSFPGKGVLRAIDYASLEHEPGGGFDIVVNATSASLRTELPPVSANAFGSGCLAYELAYGKGLTPFLKFAQSSGAGHVADGVGMLIEQAAEAFAKWRGIRPQTSELIRQMTIPLT